MARRRGVHATVQDVLRDELTPVANENWAPGAGAGAGKPFNAALVRDIYARPDLLARLPVLDYSRYLENYLWPNFSGAAASHEHLFSILLLVNFKLADSTAGSVWPPLARRRDALLGLLQRVFELDPAPLSPAERATHLVFLIHCYHTLEEPLVRAQALRMAQLPLWLHLSQPTLQRQLRQLPQLRGPWEQLRAQGEPDALRARPESAFLPRLVRGFFEEASGAAFRERMLELLVDLVAQIHTRRFVKPFLDDQHFIARCRLWLGARGGGDKAGAAMEDEPEADEGEREHLQLLTRMLERLRFYVDLSLDEQRGTQLSEDEALRRHYARVELLQRVAFKFFREQMLSLALSNISSIDSRARLTQLLARLDASALQQLCVRLRMLPSPPESHPEPALRALARDPRFLTEVLVSAHELLPSQRRAVRALSLYPTEAELFDERVVPRDDWAARDAPLAIPKLNLQFLTLYDYLMRCFLLFRLESTYEIREDLEAALRLIRPVPSGDGAATVFTGLSRSAAPLSAFSITQVRKPAVGHVHPAGVSAEAEITLAPFAPHIRAEWEEIKPRDVLFLLAVRARSDGAPPQVLFVRGGEVTRVVDEVRGVVGEFDAEGRRRRAVGNVRRYQLELDPAQYYRDRAGAAAGDESDGPYGAFNLLLRRRAKENNFKAVLHTIRELMDDEESVPEWLFDTLLGYSGERSGRQLLAEPHLRELRFSDTFLDSAHVEETLSDYEVRWRGARELPPGMGVVLRFPEPPSAAVAAPPPAPAPAPPPAAPPPAAPPPAAPSSETLSAAQLKRLTVPQLRERLQQRGLVPSGLKADLIMQLLASYEKEAAAPATAPAPAPAPVIRRPVVEAELYAVPDRGPFASHVPRRNEVRFTATQVRAVCSGLQPGLTLVVGPPGTGKTDVAVQIVSELHHNHPQQRTLLVAHSNHALNDLFEKLLERDIDERYMLRLGHGEEALASARDFSKAGRVDHMLARRSQLLGLVEELARAMGVADESAMAYSCETAQHFFLLHVEARWEAFEAAVRARSASGAWAGFDWAREFPFTAYFSRSQQQRALFAGGDPAACMAEARQLHAELTRAFAELEETRPFEVLHRHGERCDYLLARHAKVIAMTCTHAAMQRGALLELGFQYDNLVMEEAAQVLEVETFVPMVLQRHDKEFGCRLKRVVLLGDHNQLPPIVKNVAIQRFAHMEQSMFARLVRVGVPSVQLDAQGRMRASLAALWSWRYERLGNLPHVQREARFAEANPGLAFEYQFVDVADFEGRGESQPAPFFYQNLGEAEFAVQLFMYMRLLGYPASAISILTTYNGQRALIRDVLARRCARSPLFGLPHAVSTVDKYQGQQNDYVILSLVRTRAPGHIRDVRRLVVALSRARLGLYVLGRQALFQNCLELAPALSLLLQRPTQLMLVEGESYAMRGSGWRRMGEPVRALAISGLVQFGALVAALAQRQLAAAKDAAIGSAGASGQMTAGNSGKQGAAVEEEDGDGDDDPSAAPDKDA
jgi:intron-binding protein aquarius